MAKVVSCIDIGTSKIVCLIAQLNSENKLCIKSASIHESDGVLDGNIININAAAQAITKALAKAEKIFKKNIDIVSVNISGNSLKSKNITVEVGSKVNRTIGNDSILQLANKIDEGLRSESKVLIHLFPIGFSVDGVKTNNPLDIVGRNLRATLHIFYTDKLKVDNIVNCLKKVDMSIHDFIFSGYASALATLSSSEKINGSLVVDIGASITSFSVIYNNKFIFGNSIPIAGNSITKVLAEKIGTVFSLAEKIKLLNANLFLDEVENDEIIKISIDDKETFKVAKIKKKVVNEVFGEGIAEIIRIIFELVSRKGLMSKIKKIVVTGGTANVLGIDNYISTISGIETRIGYVLDDFHISSSLNKEKIKNPSYTTSVGLLKAFMESYKQKNINDYKSNKNNFVNRTIDFLIDLFIT
ncbi:MAG: cell division protein FtsA [Rickettsiales bacterium]|jgi:cell division protein FtsA|nr:cell division protein FtsA [Rickettsiales bacterium]